MDKMLTSGGSNQYLRPEYLTPLPTTLDAKKSPLALLAQTCSQIGADSPNPKLLQNADKSGVASKKPPSADPFKDKARSTPSGKQQSRQADSPSQREKTRSPEERSQSVHRKTPSSSSLKNGQVNGRCGSNQSAASMRESPAEQLLPRRSPAEDGRAAKTPPDRSASERSNSSPPQTPSKTTAFTPNILTSSSDPAIKDLPLGTFKPGVVPPPPVSSAFLTYPGFATTASGLPMDLMMGARNPYFSAYGRLKSPQDTLATVCRDPYCTGCGLSSHLLGQKVAAATQQPPCPAGCSQCDHAKLPPTTIAAAASYGAAAYAHAQLAALAAASHLPYVCNWISGDASYCGKRFSTSEDLLAHLRTHTSSSSNEAAAAAAAAAALSLGLPPSHPLLHRTYPTPPLSPLATARYHPYGKPSLLPPSLGGFPLGHPALPPYLSPYSLYAGPRLGSTPSMHP